MCCLSICHKCQCKYFGKSNLFVIGSLRLLKEYHLVLVQYLKFISCSLWMFPFIHLGSYFWTSLSHFLLLYYYLDTCRWEMLESQFPCIDQPVLPLQHQCLQVQRWVLKSDCRKKTLWFRHILYGYVSFISHSFLYICVYFFGLMQPLPNSQSQTVVVENPMSVDKSGKLVGLFVFITFFPLQSELLFWDHHKNV